MDEIIKKFEELSTDELYRIYKLRTAVFVVEQHCPYQEVDEIDIRAVHLWLEEGNEIVAYARVYTGNNEKEARIGRVIAVRRRQGFGTAIVKKAIDYIEKKTKAEQIVLEAQVYAAGLYEKCGFEKTSEPFDEDGIPHVRMEREIERR